MSVFATPHRWTPFFAQSAHRRVLTTDLRLWDYKHQVLETPRVPAWRVFLWVKLIEAALQLQLQLRPRVLWRIRGLKDAELRHAQAWYTSMGRGVWLAEWRDFLTRRARPGPKVAEVLGAEALPEMALSAARQARKAAK